MINSLCEHIPVRADSSCAARFGFAIMVLSAALSMRFFFPNKVLISTPRHLRPMTL